VLDRLKAGEQALVPAFWSLEVLNILLLGEKKGRITAQQTQAFLDDLRALDPVLDYASLEQVAGPVQIIDKRQLTFYSRTMIEGFKHKGLRNLFEQDDARKVKADQVDRLRLILSTLDQAGDVQDMNQPTFRLHPLKGNRKGVWAVTVRANWRVTFRFEGGDAYDVDLEDYH
jgi:proteic killer suppression protein